MIGNGPKIDRYFYHLQGEEGGGKELEVAVEPASQVLEGGRESQLVVQRDEHVAGEGDGGERGRPEQPQLWPVQKHLRRLTHQCDRRQKTTHNNIYKQHNNKIETKQRKLINRPPPPLPNLLQPGVRLSLIFHSCSDN